MHVKEKNRVAINLGKRRSYFVVEKDGIVVREGYADSSVQGFNDYLSEVEEGSRVIVEACNSIDRVARMLKGYRIVVVHPYKVRIIAESIKKTDKNDAHILLDLDRIGQLHLSYIPDERIRKNRDLCRNRYFLIRQRNTVKTRIKDFAYRLGMDFGSFNNRRLEILKGLDNPVLNQLIGRLEDLDKGLKAVDLLIHEAYSQDSYAKLIDTLLGFAEYSSLAISSEIGEISRFAYTERLYAYAGLVPSIRQSGNYEHRGKTIKGNGFMKYLLVEASTTFLRCCKDSLVYKSYVSIAKRAGKNKAKIAAARRILGIIYYMLRRGKRFDPSYGRETSNEMTCAFNERDRMYDAPLPNQNGKREYGFGDCV